MTRVSAPIAEIKRTTLDQPHSSLTRLGTALVGTFTILWFIGLAQAQPSGIRVAARLSP
jgi:hypothetical protein